MISTIRRYFKRWLLRDAEMEVKSLKYQFAMTADLAKQLIDSYRQHGTKLKAMEARITLLEAQLKDMEGDL